MLTALFLGIGSFCGCWVFHVLVWRIHRPQGYLIWLPVIFVGLPVASLLVAIVSGGLSADSLPGIEVGLPAVALHLLISACYTCSYAGLTEYSPSAEVLKVVRSHMPDGVRPGELKVLAFTEHSLTGKRLEDLVHSGLVEILDGKVWLTPAGRRANGLCRSYRRMTGVSDYGEG